MDTETAKKRRAEEKIQKLKLLKMFAKNPTLKDTTAVLAPQEEATLLERVQAKQKEQGLQHRVKIGS